jgi:hypothetical protein
MANPSTCEHFFVPKEEKETPSCTGTHDVRCQKCDMGYHEYTANVSFAFYEDYYEKRHKGEIEKKSKQEIEEELHRHAWDLISETDNSETYKCISAVTDWEASKPNLTYRKPCDQIIILNK